MNVVISGTCSYHWNWTG